MRLAAAMKNSTFRIVPLAGEVAEAAREAAARRAPDYAIVTADSPNGYPCRHCLRWARVGERMILFPYASVPPGHPYSETGPIFIHSEPCERYASTSKYPEQFRQGRVFRAYDSANNLIDAILPNRQGPEAVIEKLLKNPETAYVHARSATHGCYTFAIERI
jgi:Protein of unknown function (DUF1203)